MWLWGHVMIMCESHDINVCWCLLCPHHVTSTYVSYQHGVMTSVTWPCVTRVSHDHVTYVRMQLTFSSPPPSPPSYPSDLALSLQNESIVKPCAQLCHNSSQLAREMWIQLFPRIWAILTDRQRQVTAAALGVTSGQPFCPSSLDLDYITWYHRSSLLRC